MAEHKIGEVFNRKGKTLKIQSASEIISNRSIDPCTGCAYLKDGICTVNHDILTKKLESCFGGDRKGNTSIIFVEVK